MDKKDIKTFEDMMDYISKLEAKIDKLNNKLTLVKKEVDKLKFRSLY